MPRLPLLPDSGAVSSALVDALAAAALGVTLFFSALIAALILVFLVRYRRRAPRERGAPTRDSLRLELLWSAVPLAITLGLFAWGADVFVALTRVPPDAVEYFVVGKRWMWKLQHPSGRREINTLHVPVDTPVRLTMTSEDVVHSFYVPAFRIKQDVLPGRYTSLAFEAVRTGRYALACAEYCGTEHALMRGEIVVMEPGAYARWLESGDATTPLRESGAALFQELGCHTCHVAGDASRGPPLEGLAGSTVQLADGRTVTADDSYLRESIVDPAAKVTAGFEPLMPTYRGQVDEDALVQLVSYLRTLGADDGEEAP